MTDFRHRNDPARPAYDARDPMYRAASDSWSAATWGWIAGIAVVLLVLIFAFGTGREQVATGTNSPPAVTTGQGNAPQQKAPGSQVPKGVPYQPANPDSR